MQPSVLLASGLEKLLNYYLRLDPEALAAIAALNGKVLAVELVIAPPATGSDAGGGLTATLFVQPGAEGVRVTDSHWGTPDVSIRGTPLALARQFNAQGGGLDPAVELRGDVQLGQAFQAVLASVDVDWEEHLSKLVGDTAAHQMGNVLRDLGQWGRQVLNTLMQDAGEFFQEESRALPPHGAVAEFLDEVDQLRDDVERMAARVRRLQQADEQKAP
ncbi:MAG: SCP2 sterol-binding domain-containing protein [Gammaproteobacteria bacterium]|nr:SCP2 sterol-binding domain-containing protein [Gammaproteobacteria bacterium]MCP5459562.1 SCP2 sterol-binding domain-containing protein [Gammaproteobacteria bacterium]